MTYKLNEIQVASIHLENETIEHMIKETSKNYADIIKTSIINIREKDTTEIRIQQRQQHDILHQEQAKYEITLTIKKTNDEIKELINIMPSKEIIKRCQHVIEKTFISNIKLQEINKFINDIRIQCTIKE